MKKIIEAIKKLIFKGNPIINLSNKNGVVLSECGGNYCSDSC